jgi:hypothetical protein
MKMEFAIMLDSDSTIGRRHSACQLFNNFCKVEGLDLEYSNLYRTVASRFGKEERGRAFTFLSELI